ncbi:MAG TPA: aminodeoxychorismate synthase component I [Saprospiraceae bacterium]|nr:aminodeoxychorismate synthase component I [Saprospiraceae bacterium]
MRENKTEESGHKQMNWVDKMNQLGKEKSPFIFILDFELKNPVILKIGQIPNDIYYKFNDIKNYTLSGTQSKPLHFLPNPMPIGQYTKAFDAAKKEILYGNSFLLNLTFPTPIETNYTLRELFNISHARYKLYYKDQFIVSSPEIFIKIINGKIFTFPMKGTIDASIPDATSNILNDVKETAEHYTIVDLLRNDLSMVANNVKVNKFRYIDKLVTSTKTLLQVSSEIEGTLPIDFNENLGNIFAKLLPAGSISGAPKKKTVEIIKANEIDDRGYYTGVFGIFDGNNVDSGVMIRYIEKQDEKLIYRSGCGITYRSECTSEYQEMIDKVYIPLGKNNHL